MEKLGLCVKGSFKRSGGLRSMLLGLTRVIRWLLGDIDILAKSR